MSEPGGLQKGIALASLAAALAAAAAGVVVVQRAVQRMPALSARDSMIVSGGRPGTRGAAPPSPVRPVLRERPPARPAAPRQTRDGRAPLGGPGGGPVSTYPRIQ